MIFIPLRNLQLGLLCLEINIVSYIFHATIHTSRAIILLQFN